MDADDEEAHRGPSVAGEGTIRWLAEAAFVGVPVLEYLRTEDSDERALLAAVKEEGVKVLSDTITNLAREIVKETAEAQKRGSKKKPNG